MDLIQEFMESPLVTWVRTFESDGGKSLCYAALADGVFLYDVMAHISPRSAMSRNCGSLNRCPEDATARLGNLTLLISFVNTFYQEFLNQVMLSSPPEVVKLSKMPETSEGVEELRKLLLLVLGCAVQSPLKEDVISNIKGLPLHTQHEIVQCIQEVTDNPETVWPPEWGDLEAVPAETQPKAYSLLVRHCRRLALERDKYLKDFLRYLLGDSDSDETEDNVHHLGVQLAESKALLRRLRQDLDEKVESCAEMKEELEEVKETLSRLRQENVELGQDARAARALRDELDMVRERASRVDALEAEVSRFRDKMSDVEFYKTRVEELREDNRILVETKEMLEDQLATSRRRAEQVLDLENTILQLKQQINHLNVERDADRERLHRLMEENAQLELSTRSSLSESATLAAQMENLKTRSSPSDNSNVGSDLIGEAKTRALKLELENQRLEGEVEKLRRENHLNYQDKLLELEKENKRLSIKVTNLQESSQKEKTQIVEVQQILHARERESDKLKDVINTVKMNAERQTQELQSENCHLQDLIETLRERQKKTTNDRLHDVEKENKKLIDNNIQLQSQVSRLEYEKQQLNKLSERLRESSEKLVEAELQKAEIERENKELHRAITSFKESCEKHELLEESYASLEVEFTRVSKVLDNTKESLSKMETAQSEKAQLQIEVDKLKRSLENFKTSSGRLVDLEAERDQLLSQINHLNQQLDTLKIDRGKVDQLELELLTANTEVQKVKRAHEVLQKRLQDSEKEKGEAEAENTKLQRAVETLKLTTKKLNEMEKDLTDVETTNDRLDRENRSLKKEVDRLRGSLEVKDSLVEEMSVKVSKLERDNKKMAKDIDASRVNEDRVRAMEQQKREMDHQILIERKTLTALREDLVAEKVKSQQVSNQLESITSDLSKLGLNADSLSRPVSDAEEDRYKALEAMLEETLKRSVELREEKISSLEARLGESAHRNQQLKNQLLQVRSEYESLVQRTQEEGNELSLDSSRELARMKDSLQRANEEKLSLENDVSVLSTQSGSYREQVCALQSQVTSLSNQNTVMSQHNATLQSDNAKQQVENTTLQSQSASLIAQNSSLQTTATQLGAEKDKLKRQHEERGLRLTQLVSDHESLQKLHEQLTQDYDQLTQEHNALKASQKTLKNELKAIKEKQKDLSASEDDLLKLRETLEAEMQNLRNDSNSLSNLRAEHSRLKDDFRSLFTTNERVRGEYRSIQEDYKAIKTENNALKLKTIELGGQLNETRDQMAVLDVETNKLTNKCQFLESVNHNLEEDRRSLMSQVSMLLTQYHDLLTQTLEDKQHFHQEEKNFTDKLNNLRRQKEKLEEKIMEQFKRMDNSQNKKKGFGSNLVKKVRKAGNDLMNKVPRSGRSRSRNREDLDSPDSSSLGSSPANDSLDSGSDTRRSSPNPPPSPREGRASLGGQVASQTSLTASTVSRKSSGARPDISDLFIPGSLSVNSLSSEEVNSTTCFGSNDNGDPPNGGEDPLPGVDDTSELTRAGSRRGLYLARETTGPSPSPISQNSLRDSFRGQNCSRKNSSSSLPHQSRNILVNGSILSSVNGSPKHPSTPNTPRGAVPPPTTSTPKVNNSTVESFSSNRGAEEEKRSTTTPKLPPRNDQITYSAPELPPRISRRGSNAPSDSSPLPSSQSPSSNGTPELRPKGLTHQNPPRPPDLPLKPGAPTTKDGVVNNSVWYEYGCV